jgi:hypothetical protein
LRRSLTFIPLLMILAILGSAAPAAARSKMAIGVSTPPGPGVSTLDALDAHIAATGVTPALWSLWSNWGSRGGHADCVPGDGNCAFPTDVVNELFSRGITPVIWWQPVDPDNPLGGKYNRYVRIVKGKHDKYIKQWAVAARNASKAAGGKPILIRFAHEATGRWFPWGIGIQDNTSSNYKQAWRHIVRKFQQVGARRSVRFVWSNYIPRAKAYPGDRYVDYVGATILNFGSAKKVGWRSMTWLVARAVKASLKITKKPIILAEVASHFRGGNKAAWIKKGYLSTFRKYPKIKAALYLDTNQPQIGQRHPDWRLIRPYDGSALSAYTLIAKNPKFRGHLYK